jgi:hypothetical protein
MDWDIECEFVPGSKMNNINAVGSCSSDASLKRAGIKILHPSELDPVEDIDQILVHELLHVMFQMDILGITPKDGARWIAMEQAIELTSMALAKGWEG